MIAVDSNEEGFYQCAIGIGNLLGQSTQSVVGLRYMHLVGKGSKFAAGPGHSEGDFLPLSKFLHSISNLYYISAVLMS